MGGESSVTCKKSPNVYKSCPKMISLENEKFWHLYKNCLIMLPQAFKSCPMCNKSPNLVTLGVCERENEMKRKRGTMWERERCRKWYIFCAKNGNFVKCDNGAVRVIFILVALPFKSPPTCPILSRPTIWRVYQHFKIHRLWIQCDQMARLFFKIWPFKTMDICPILL